MGIKALSAGLIGPLCHPALYCSLGGRPPLCQTCNGVCVSTYVHTEKRLGQACDRGPGPSSSSRRLQAGKYKEERSHFAHISFSALAPCKILLLTCKPLNGQAPLYHKELRVPCHLTGVSFFESPKVEEESSTIELLSCGLRSHLGLEQADTLTIFKSRLKTFLLFDKAYISGEPSP
ncbi:hypothetical protein L3Q82_013994 [Scortum barcoo]|uniref:Uncharacterized protein n=1 Tax=Scortum barcoo TaxID=214431 RepID=A0ACB8VVX9_9TELE|nr:hypothetical protein L3Q82_013994 [Scortum barcoo]